MTFVIPESVAPRRFISRQLSQKCQLCEASVVEQNGFVTQKARREELKNVTWTRGTAPEQVLLRLQPAGPHLRQHDHRVVRLHQVLRNAVSTVDWQWADRWWGRLSSFDLSPLSGAVYTKSNLFLLGECVNINSTCCFPINSSCFISKFCLVLCVQKPRTKMRNL